MKFETSKKSEGFILRSSKTYFIIIRSYTYLLNHSFLKEILKMYDDFTVRLTVSSCLLR